MSTTTIFDSTLRNCWYGMFGLSTALYASARLCTELPRYSVIRGKKVDHKPQSTLF